MRVILDLNLSQLIVGPGQQSPISDLTVPRGVGSALRVACYRDGLAETLTEDFQVRWTCKAAADYSGPEVAYLEDFETSGHEALGFVNYESEGLDALLNIGEEDELASIIILAQLAFRESDADAWQSTQPLALTVLNSIWRGDGVPPVGLIASWKYYSSITGLTGGGSTKLDGIISTTLAIGSVARLIIGSVISEWQLQAGTTAEDAGAGIVRPDDYADSENEKIWIQIA